MTRSLDLIPLDDLEGNPANPKAHDTGTIDASISRLGYVEPVVVDERTGFLVSGHGRVATLRGMAERGEEPPEGIERDEEGHWLVPAVTGWASRSDTEASAALIALNRTTELGGWVDEELLGLLDGLSEAEDGLYGVGFGEAEMDELRRVLDSWEVAFTFDNEDTEAPPPTDPTTPSGVDPTEVGMVDILDDGLCEVRVVLPEDDREEFYGVLADLEYVVDARNARSR